MKYSNLFKSFLLALIAAMLPQLASAYDFMVDGLCYNYNEDGISVTVTYENTTYPRYSSLNGDIVIPESVTRYGSTYLVTSIDDEAFCDCAGLTSVTIPNSVTTIGWYAFSGCTCLTSVTIGNSVTSIGHEAFSNCSGLTSVTIPNSVTSIDDEAFMGCTGLTSVTIGNSVTSIGDLAFEACPGLTSVTIPNSVTSIGERAFSGCTGLTSVTIGNSVTSIGNHAFEGCSGLTSMVVESGNTKYDSRNNCNAIIKTARNALMFGCKNTIIPNSVTSIDGGAFAFCTGLSSVSIPNSVTSIGDGAFQGCTGLTSVTLNSNTIVSETYTSNTNINTIFGSQVTEYIIGNLVTSIGAYAFFNCTGLTSITIPNSVTSIGYNTFNNCSGLTNLTLSGQGTWNPKSNMPSISQIKTLNIGSGITSLGNFGFAPDVVNCYAENPPVCSSGTFSSYEGELHVPPASMFSYFTANYWQNFNNLVNDLTEKVTLDKTNANLTQWESLTLAATVAPDDCEVLWSSSKPSVAIVDENGVVTANGVGECDIFATLASNPAVYAICHITTSYPEITLSLSDESIEINVGNEQTITATITPENTGLTPAWSSSNTSIATVDENGKVTAIGEGECDIIATVLDKTATCHVTVTNNVTITLNIENAILGANQMLTVYPSSSPDVPVELVVTSSDPSVAVARVVNRTNAPAAGLMSFPEKGMALAMMEELAVPSESNDPALASTKAIMIVGAQSGTATITVTTADGKATPAVLELRVIDVDGDRTITASDITLLYNYLLSGDDTYFITSDVNGDGAVTSADVTVLYDLLLGN